MNQDQKEKPMSHVHDPYCPVATVYDAMGDRPVPMSPTPPPEPPEDESTD